MKIMNTKRRLARFLGVLVALCLMGSLGAPVLAEPPPEFNHLFYGVVTSQGTPVDDGVPIVAKVNGEPCGETTVGVVPGYDEYNYSFEITQEVASPDDPIEFYVNDVRAELYDADDEYLGTSYPFGSNDFATELNLKVDIETFTITATAGENGAIEPSGDVSVNSGASQAFTITPSEGYEIADVLVDSVSVLGDLVDDTYTFENVTAGHTIDASFALQTFTITSTAEAGGSIDPLGVTEVDYGADQAFTITAETGYEIADVLVDDTSALADVTIVEGVGTYTFENVVADRTIDATFTLQTFTITPTAGEGGTISPSEAVEVAYGTDKAFTITPDTGYEILDVLVDGTSALADVTIVEGVGTYTFENVVADQAITASFAVTITHELIMLVDGEGTVTPGTGTYAEGEMAITATIPASGWEFAGWATTDMTEIADPTSAETTLTLDKDKTVTATFTEVVTYDLTVDSTDGGSVTSPVEGTSTHNAGTVVNLVAVPEEDYTFGWWSGDVVADVNAASTTITMDSAKSIVANFVEFIAPENVSVTEIDPGVESVTVTIEPVEELDVTEMPAGIDPQEAYVVDPTGTGSFTLVFTVSDTSDLRVYKVVDGTWTLLEFTVVDATTIKVTMDVADPILVFALPPTTIATTTLSAEWNLLSTPILLEAESDTLGQIFGTDVDNIVISYSWDAQNEDWDQLTNDYELLPLYGIYVKVSSGTSATAEFIPSAERSEPPSRELQPGLNLIGPAPAFDLEAGDFPIMPLDEALISIKVAGEFWGYCMVVSPPHNQTDWTYPPWEIKDLLPFKGYWVVMDNADTLFGFSTTPLE